jgi:phosphopantetheinyl transferase
MQAVESETLILYHSDLRGQWPEAAARSLAGRLPYGKRLEVAALSARAAATLAGVALALRALARVTGRACGASELAFPQHGKPRLRRAPLAAGQPGGRASAPPGSDGPDFSISHSGHWVGCAAVARGLVGFDLESGSEARHAEWAAREAALKACGLGVAHAREVRLHDGHATCLERTLYARALGLFPGAAACVMTSLAIGRVESRALSLEELFAP